jgi:hypothetical protein
MGSREVAEIIGFFGMLSWTGMVMQIIAINFIKGVDGQENTLYNNTHRRGADQMSNVNGAHHDFQPFNSRSTR